MQSDRDGFREGNENYKNFDNPLVQNHVSKGLEFHGLCSDNVVPLNGRVVPCLTKATNSDSSKIEVQPTLTKDRLVSYLLYYFHLLLLVNRFEKEGYSKPTVQAGSVSMIVDIFLSLGLIHFKIAIDEYFLYFLIEFPIRFLSAILCKVVTKIYPYVLLCCNGNL